MKSLISIFGLIFGSACLMICQPKTVFGQDDKSSTKIKPPVVVRYVKKIQRKTKIKRQNSANFKSASNKRKNRTLRRKVDLSKVPRVIKVIKRP